LPDHIIIKKYSNRRLYDTTHKKYVTLDEIASLIKEGTEIKVIDSQTDEDITKVILMQVILESEKNKEDILPTSFLHMLIKYGNRMARDFFENYFTIMFEPYLSLQEGMKKNLQWWQETGWMPTGGIRYPGINNPFETLSKHLEKQNNIDKDGVKESSQNLTSTELGLIMEKIKELEEKVKSINKPKRSNKGKEKALDE
jgi:polyhydroxyalkanoate synthesis repressor PhaR